MSGKGPLEPISKKQRYNYEKRLYWLGQDAGLTQQLLGTNLFIYL